MTNVSRQLRLELRVGLSKLTNKQLEQELIGAKQAIFRCLHRVEVKATALLIQELESEQRRRRISKVATTREESHGKDKTCQTKRASGGPTDSKNL